MSTPAPATTGGRAAGPSETGRRRWLVLAVVLTAAFMILLDATIVNVAIPTIGRDLRASDAAVQWVVAGYALAYGLLLIPAGRLGDRFGHRWVLIIGLVGFTATSVLCGVASSPGDLVAWRIAQGAMAGVLNPPVLAIIRSVFPTRELGKAFGWYGAMAGVSTAAGPLLGGLLIAADLGGLDWRPIFLINVPVGVVTLVLVLALVPEVRGRAGDLDPVGIALITVALLLLTVPLVQGRELGWPAWTITCLVLVVPALVLFTAWERRRARHERTPLVDVALFSQRSFAAGVAVALVHFAAFIGLVFTLSLYLQLGAGQSALSTGLVLMAFALGTLVSAAASDPLTDRLGRSVLLVGSGLLAAGIAAVLLALTLAPTPVVWWLIPGLAVAGIGNGLVIAPVTTVVLAGVDRRDAGAASGVLNTAQRVGQALGTAILGLVLFTALATALTGGATPLAAYTRAIELALLGALAAAAATFALVFALPRLPHRKR
jgi:EmrB/QacA subfamily drug resistance transporter